MSLITRYSQLLEDAFGYPENFTESQNISRGNSDFEDNASNLKSELPGIATDDEWTRFCKMMLCAPLSSVSDSNELGMFQMKPRRLADLGIVTKLARKKAPSGRTVWTAIFAPPMTSDKYLRSPEIQYKVFSISMKNYVDSIHKGTIKKDIDMSLSGALGLLHKAGPKALETWRTNERFPSTQAAYIKVAGIF